MKKIAFLLVFTILFAGFAGCLGDDEDIITERPVAEIWVENLPISNGTYHTSINVPIRFNASRSIDVDGDIKTYQWSFDDGGLGYESVLSHIFLEEGTYTVLLTVKDNDGKTDQDMVTISVVGEASFGIMVQVATSTHLASPGRESDFAVFLMNEGNTEETFEIKAGILPAGWTFKAEDSFITLLPGEQWMTILTYKVSVTASKVNTEVSCKVVSTTDETTSVEKKVNVDVKTAGDGPAGIGDLVQCQYIGWYVDGEVFDSSMEEFKEGRGDVPLKVSLGDTSLNGYTTVISGFKDALVGMRVGETNVVRLTSEEGYNDGQVRLFEVGLVSIDS